MSLAYLWSMRVFIFCVQMWTSNESQCKLLPSGLIPENRLPTAIKYILIILVAWTAIAFYNAALQLCFLQTFCIASSRVIRSPIAYGIGITPSPTLRPLDLSYICSLVCWYITASLNTVLQYNYNIIICWCIIALCTAVYGSISHVYRLNTSAVQLQRTIFFSCKFIFKNVVKWWGLISYYEFFKYFFLIRPNSNNLFQSILMIVILNYD